MFKFQMEKLTTVFVPIFSKTANLEMKFTCLSEGNGCFIFCFVLLTNIIVLKLLYFLLYCIYSAPSFHLPQDTSLPILLVGPGTGVAPFRSFWHHRREQETNDKKLGPAWLFFGCRNRQMDLYSHEKAQMQKEGVLSRVFLALSREEGVPKVRNYSN